MQDSGAASPDSGKWRARWIRVKLLSADWTALFWFSCRLTLGIQAFGLAAIAVGIFIFCALGQTSLGVGNIFLLLLSLETMFFILLSMGLLPREKEGRTLELLLVCARGRHELLLHKFLPICLFVAAVALGLTSGFRWLVGGFSWPRMLCVPYALAATAGILTVVLTTYFRNQYGAGAVALLIAIVVATLWLDPLRTFYGFEAGPTIGRARPHVTTNRVILAIVFVFLYDHAVRRLKHVELWMK